MMRQEEEDPILEQNCEEEAVLEHNYREEPFRYCVLALYILMSFPIGICYFGYAGISPQMHQLFGLTTAQLNLINASYFGMSIAFFIPSAYTVSYCTMKFNVRIIVIVVIVGAWMETLLEHSFALAVIGRYIFSISAVFLKNIATRISSVWFAADKRVISTSIMNSSSEGFDVLSLCFPVFFVGLDYIPESKESEYRGYVYRMIYFKAICSTVAGIIMLIFFREQPSQPVSPSSTIPRAPLKQTISALVKNKGFIILALFLAITDGGNDAFRTILREGFSKYGMSSHLLSISGIISSAAVFVAVNIVACLSSKVRKIKIFLLVCGLICSLLYVFALICMELMIKQGLAAILVLQVMATSPTGPLIFELVAQFCFPIPQGFSSSVANFVLKLATFSLIQISDPFITHSYIKFFVILLIALQTASTLSVRSIEENFIRRGVDEENEEHRISKRHLQLSIQQ